MAVIVEIYPDEATWVEEAAAEIGRTVEQAVAHRGAALVALSGGRTPSAVYRRLTLSPWRERLPWAQVQWVWVDERWVNADHPDSNFGMVWEVLLSKVPVDRAQIYQISTEGISLEQSVLEYEAKLRSLVARHGSGLDLAVLGMGADGHTASLFPGSPAVAETQRWVAATHSPAGIRQRITLTFPLLNATDTVVFLVTGAEKHPVLEKVLHQSSLPVEEYPAAKVRATGRTIWCIDNDAAKAKDDEYPRGGRNCEQKYRNE